MDPHTYYHHPSILQSLHNFFEGCSWFLVGGSQYTRDPSWGKEPRVRVFPIEELDQQLGQGPDLFRPLTNKTGVLGVFDIEYYHADKKSLFTTFNNQPYGFRHHMFRTQLEPIYQYLSDTFQDESIIDITWSGYHLLTQLERQTPVYQKLLELGKNQRNDGTPQCLEHSLLIQYLTPDPHDIKRNIPTSIEDGIVYHQFGRVLEYLSHNIIKDVNSQVDFPITICDTTQEGLSLDLSQYADPVFMRIIRTIFSTWDKHNINDMLRDYVNQPPFIDVIRKYQHYENNDLDFLFPLHQDLPNSIQYHQQFSGTIPIANRATLKLIESYEQSSLRQFHLDFDQEEHDPTDERYTMAKYHSLLDINARNFMQNPNPSLLQPWNIKWLTEHLIEKNWHPKHIAGMLASIYDQKEHNWDDKYWEKYNSKTRADFWVRIYTGLKLANQ